MSIVLGQQIGKKLAEALGLPPRTIWFELRVAVNEVVSVKLEHVVDSEKAGEALALLRHYTVMEKLQGDGVINARPCDPEEPTL